MRGNRLTMVAAMTALAVACADRTPPPEPDEPEPEANSNVVPGAADIDALALEAEVQGSPVEIRGTLTVRNPTDRTIQFDVGGCPIFVRLYDTGGAVAWDQGDGAVCTMILRTVTLEPGASETFETGTTRAAEILGDELPEGRYRAGVYLALVEGGQPEAPAGEVELAAGG